MPEIAPHWVQLVSTFVVAVFGTGGAAWVGLFLASRDKRRTGDREDRESVFRRHESYMNRLEKENEALHNRNMDLEEENDDLMAMAKEFYDVARDMRHACNNLLVAAYVSGVNRGEVPQPLPPLPPMRKPRNRHPD